MFPFLEFDVYLKSKLAEVQQRNLENKLRSAEFYSARNGYDVGSKASVYWTPPTALDGNSEFGSPAIRSAGLVAPYRGGDVDSGLQLSPIHINYINENLDTMIGFKPLINSRKFLAADDDAFGYRLPPHLDRLRMYLCPERLVGGNGRLDDDSGPSGLQQKNDQLDSAESISNNIDGMQTQKNGSNEDNNWCSCDYNSIELEDDDEEEQNGAAGIKVTLRQLSTPHERKSLLVSESGVRHSASCHLGASMSNEANRIVTKKRFGNEYYHSVEDVVGDEDLLRNNHHNNHHNNHAANVLPIHTPSSSASKSPSCRCCPRTISIPSTTTLHSSSVVEHHPLQQNPSTSRVGNVQNDINISEINDLFMSGGGGGTTNNESGSVGRATAAGDKLNIILDETGKPMLVNQCDNRLLLLQTSASLPEMQSMRSMVTNGGALSMPLVQQHHTTVEVHDGRHDVVLSVDGVDSDCADSGCSGGASVGCLPKIGRYEDTNV